ncbi:MAG: TonB-dependent receptor, partial [Pseudomonadota bacterium]
MKKCFFSAAAVGSVVSSATPVLAQEQEDSFRLAPIIIDAQLREQPAVDVPISVNVVERDMLEARQSKRASDVVNHTPNAVATPQRGGNDATSISIRGVGTTAFGAGPSVAVYVDDVYVGADSGFNLSIPDLERVTILRGPQGTLAGRNALAGSINLDTGDPLLGVTQTDVEVGFGTHRHFSAELTQNVDINDRSALRFSFRRAVDEGWVENQQGGPDLDSEDNVAARLKLLYDPTDAWSALLSVDYARDRGRTGAFGLIDTVLDDGVNAAQPYDEEVENGGVSLKNVWATGFGEVTSITAWRFSESSLGPGSVAPVVFDLRSGDRDYDQFTQELRINGATERLDWVLGAFFLESEDDRQEDLEIAVPLPPDFLFPGQPALAQGYAEVSDSNTKTRSAAVFADGTFALTDRLDLVGGIRLSYDRNEIDYRHDGNQGLPFSLFALQQFVEDSVTTQSASPRLGLTYAVTPESNLYAMISSAYKPAGFNIAFASTPDLQYEEESAINYEIGAKGALLDGRLNYALAAFYMDWRDQQVLTFDSATNSIAINNAKKSRSVGVEAQADMLLSDRTSLQVSLGYNDATFVDFSNAPTGDASGNSQPLAPKYSVGLGVEHRVPLNMADLILRGFYNWRSEFYFDAANTLR